MNMSQHSDSVVEHLNTEPVPAQPQRPFIQPSDVLVRRSIASGIGWLIIGGIWMTFGVVGVGNFRGETGFTVIGAVFLLLGVWNLIRGLIWLADRAPVLILSDEALIDCRSYPQQQFAWSNVERANLYRTTRRGSEESATLTLYLREAVGGKYQVRINLSNLNRTGQDIFSIIGRRADLK
jgi:hypothetical protein